MEGTADNLSLLLTRELVEMNGIARYANGKIGIRLGILVSLQEGFAVHHVYVDMMRPLGKISVKDRNEVIDTLFFIPPERLGGDREGVRDPVTGTYGY